MDDLGGLRPGDVTEWRTGDLGGLRAEDLTELRMGDLGGLRAEDPVELRTVDLGEERSGVPTEVRIGDLAPEVRMGDLALEVRSGDLPALCPGTDCLAPGTRTEGAPETRTECLIEGLWSCSGDTRTGAFFGLGLVLVD